MRVAITADVHLSRQGTHPERLEALCGILKTLDGQNIETLVIAGDLFDESCTGYAGFEEVCRRHSGTAFHIIPGNHDPDISERTVVGGNISIHQRTTVMEIDGVQMVFVPYSGSSGMGEHLEELDLSGRWVLIGHGDYLEGVKERNPYEKGTYMPLYRKDIERYQPWKVFLGHIHRPSRHSNLYYPGSPCGMDINETGRRRFLVFDTSTGRVSSENVGTGLLYFQEKLLVIPDDNELERLRNHAAARIAAWGLDRGERNRARVRIRATGYTSDREAVMDCLREVFADYSFYGGEEPDISSLRTAGDIRRNAVARRAIELIEEIDWNYGGDQPDKEQVIEAALSVVFGEGGG